MIWKRFFLGLLLIGSTYSDNVELKCSYGHAGVAYRCRVSYFLLLINRDTNLTITGTHMAGKTDLDVTKLEILNSNVFPIHSEFIKKFPNVTIVEIQDSRLKMTGPMENGQKIITLQINRVDIPGNFLENLVNLELLGFQEFSTFKFEENSFENLKKLRKFEIIRAKITEFPPRLLHPLENLERLTIDHSNLSHVSENILASSTKLKKLSFLRLYNDSIQHLGEESFTGLDNLGELWFTDNNLTVLRKHNLGKLPSVHKIALFGNNIKKIEQGAFAGSYTTLKVLDLKQNQLEVLEGHEFQNLSFLELLYLSKNILTRISTKSFKDLISMRTLLLSENKLTFLGQNLFKNNQNLRYLDVSSNEIFAIHSGILENLVNLMSFLGVQNQCIHEDLNIENGDFELLKRKLEVCFRKYAEFIMFCDYTKDLTDYICTSKDLNVIESKNLTITGDHLPSLSDSDVSTVIFEESQLTEIPSQLFTRFQNLRRLKAVSVNLQVIEPMENCKELESIDMSSNKVLHINDGLFKKCGKLHTINLSSNKIKIVSESSFALLENLRFLNLGSNKIQYIDPKSFKHCRRLRYLNLASNQLEFISEETFKDLVELEELYLNKNSLITVTSELFKGLKALQKLHLNENQIKSLGNSPLRYLKNLQEINLSHNNISSMNLQMFQPNKMLKKLLVSNSSINKIHPQFLEALFSIKFLDLSENPCVNRFFDIQDSNLLLIKKELTKCFANYLDNKFICNFVESEAGYTSLYQNVDLKNQEFYVYGYHHPEKCDSDVSKVLFESSKLELIPRKIFTNFVNLKELNVEFTGLKQINPLKFCMHLEIFKGSHNNIDGINQRTFMECSSLRVIELTSNKIKKLDVNIFGGNPNLQFIELSNNMIEKIDPCEEFQGFKKLISVNLSKNSCIDAEIQMRKDDLYGIHKKLSFCYSTWILSKIINFELKHVENKNEL